MGRNSKIIELYGLPASGKSTLVDQIIQKENINIISLDDCKKKVKKNKLKALLCFPYCNFLYHAINIFYSMNSIKIKLRNEMKKGY